MIAALAFLFLVVPFLELYVIVQVSHVFGVAPTLLTLVAVSIAGAWLVKREGLGVWRRAQRRLEDGEMPGRELVDGVLILIAGALLLTPGFLTDIVGVLLLLPPVRAAVRGLAVMRMARRIERATYIEYRPPPRSSQ